MNNLLFYGFPYFYTLIRASLYCNLLKKVSDGKEIMYNACTLIVMDSIGRAGMQLFVDAGQAVDSDLVNGLIREVLVEKVVTLLGQRPSDEEQAAEQRAVPKLSAGVDEDKMGTTEPSPRVCPQNEI